MKYYKEEGFTLIELVIVVAIMVILMGIFGTSIQTIQGNNKKETISSMNENIHTALLTYYAQTGTYPIPSVYAPGNTYDVDKNDAEAIIADLENLTGIKIIKEFNKEVYQMKLQYVNTYVLNITFESR